MANSSLEDRPPAPSKTGGLGEYAVFRAAPDEGSLTLLADVRGTLHLEEPPCAFPLQLTWEASASFMLMTVSLVKTLPQSTEHDFLNNPALDDT